MQSLPPEIRLQYLAEGAANIVYRILSPATWAQRGYLLRLHKDVPWVPPYRNLHEHCLQHIVPLFPKGDLVAQELVILPQDLSYRLNQDLAQAELPPSPAKELLPPAKSAPQRGGFHHEPFFRPKKRHGLYLAAQEPYGMLVTDMSISATPNPASNVDIGVELKPKWLAQSPNAPSGSRRCRTCALHAYRLSKQSSSNESARLGKSYSCPLDLVSGDRARLAQISQILLRESIEHLSDVKHWQVLEALTAYLLNGGVLARLRDAQLQLDPLGIMRWPADEQLSLEFLTATTLRDCTLFLRIRGNPDAGGNSLSIEARLGDLDLKNPEPGKREHWRKTEENLIEQGWYAGRGVEEEQGIDCHVGRQSWTA